MIEGFLFSFLSVLYSRHRLTNRTYSQSFNDNIDRVLVKQQGKKENNNNHFAPIEWFLSTCVEMDDLEIKDI